MAGLNAVAQSSKLSTSTSARTILRITAPANQGVRIKRWGISFFGTSTTGAKVQVDALLAGTGGSGEDSVTPRKISGHATSIQATCKEAFDSEPTSYTLVKSYSVHPQSLIEVPGNIDLAGGESFAIRANVGTAVDCVAFIEFEE